MTEVSAEKVLNTEAYMLFYKRRLRPEHKKYAAKTVATINKALGADSRGVAAGT